MSIRDREPTAALSGTVSIMPEAIHDLASIGQGEGGIVGVLDDADHAPQWFWQGISSLRQPQSCQGAVGGDLRCCGVASSVRHQLAGGSVVPSSQRLLIH